MTNIYNKFIINPNGTLINNWFEEDELRRHTGEGRTIPGKNFPKKSMDFENPITDTNPRDDTFKRIIDDNHTGRFSTTYETYGDFKYPEKKYMYKGSNEVQFDKFITGEIENQIKQKEERKDERLFDTTTASTYVRQPLEQKIGQRIMYTQEHIPIDTKRNPDKLFMAQHKMGKYPTVLSNKEIEQYIDKNIPYYNDKEITYWSTNIDKGNMYRSATLGINPFGRSNGFTQDIHHTRGVKQFEGNVTNNSASKNIYMDEKDEKFYRTYQGFHKKLSMQTEEKYPEIKEKVIQSLRKKGWTGLRQIKIYLRNLYKRKCDCIDKTEFKYNIRQWGIDTLTDSDINMIYDKFDKNKNNKINFIEFFDSLNHTSEERMNLIKSLKAKANPLNDKFISAKTLELMSDMNYHPEVMRYKKDAKEALNDYVTTWDNLKEDDLITEEDFVKYFNDISTCIESDEDFKQCLYALGLKE